MYKQATIFSALAFLFLSVPVFAAETISAGFAPSSLWISKTNLIEGDSAIIFTVLYNSSNASLSGDVIFTIDTVSIGIKHFTLDAGATEIESLSWTARTGSHTLAARIENVIDAAKVKTSLKNASTVTISVVVAAPPPPAPAATSAPMVDGVVPVIQNAGKTIYTATENARTAGAASLANALKSSTSTKNGSVLGVQTQNLSSPANPANDSIFAKMWRGLLSILLFIFNSQILFYILLLFVLYVFYKLVRVMFGDRKNRR